MCEMSSRKKRDEGWKRPGSLADFPRIARVYFRRRAAGTLPARVLDIRFWEMRSCGFILGTTGHSSGGGSRTGRSSSGGGSGNGGCTCIGASATGWSS